jgi:hypothetical protein
MELGGGQIKQLEIYDNMYDFIKKFEESMVKKPKVAPKKTKISGIEKFLED